MVGLPLFPNIKDFFFYFPSATFVLMYVPVPLYSNLASTLGPQVVASIRCQQPSADVSVCRVVVTMNTIFPSVVDSLTNVVSPLLFQLAYSSSYTGDLASLSENLNTDFALQRNCEIAHSIARRATFNWWTSRASPQGNPSAPIGRIGDYWCCFGNCPRSSRQTYLTHYRTGATLTAS